MITRKYRWTKCPKDLEERVKILVLNWILQHEGLRFSQDSFTLVLAYPLPGERSPMAVVDQVPRWWSGRQHLSLLLTALAWHPGFLWPWHTVADAVVAESTAAAAALGLPPLTLIWKSQPRAPSSFLLGAISTVVVA